MKHNFAQKSLLFVVMLIGQSAYAALVPQGPNEQELQERIEALTLDANGALSDQLFEADFRGFSLRAGRSTGVVLQAANPNFRSEQVRDLIDSIEKIEKPSTDPDKQVADALAKAFLEKMAALKEAREKQMAE